MLITNSYCRCKNLFILQDILKKERKTYLINVIQYFFKNEWMNERYLKKKKKKKKKDNVS